MESIEKLRELACDINGNEIVAHMQIYPSCVFDGAWLDAWHRAFDKELEALEREIEVSYMRLPVDADGVPIHVGDEMVDSKTSRTVVAVAPESFMMDGYETGSFYRPGLAKNHHHVKPRTLEDVFRDCCDEYHEACKSEYTMNPADIYRKYADEIRELLGGDVE